MHLLGIDDTTNTPAWHSAQHVLPFFTVVLLVGNWLGMPSWMV